MSLPLLAGNWKMHGAEGLAVQLAEGLMPCETAGVEVACFAPFIYLPLLSKILKSSKIAWGAQNLHPAESGAFTGEVSAAMLKEYGCRYVLVGHSERRAMGESAAWVAEKAQAVVAAGMTPIVCVGEQIGEEYTTVLNDQLVPVFANNARQMLQKCVIAYEPVWAIGTGQVASLERIQETHAWIREWCTGFDATYRGRILYGGSVNPKNCQQILALEEVQGLLVGGASVSLETFREMIDLCRI